jgi:hypothetical protein
LAGSRNSPLFLIRFYLAKPEFIGAEPRKFRRQQQSVDAEMLDPLSSITPGTHGNLGANLLGVVKFALKDFEILLSEMIFPGEDKPALFHYPACIMLRSPPPLAGATTGLGTAYNDGAQQTAAAWKTHSHRNPCKDSNGDVAAFDVLATYNITAKRRVVSRDLPITGLPPNFVAHARERWTFRSGVARS